MKFFIAAITLLGINTQAGEVELQHRFGLGAGVGAAIPLMHSTFTNNASTGYSLDGHADYYLSNAWGLEANYNRYNYKSSSPVSNAYGLGVIYRFFETDRLTPVAGLGLGYATTSGSGVSALNYDNIALNAKIGLDYALNSNWILSLTAKYAWMFSSGNGTNNEHGLIPQANFTYFFGASKKASGETVAPIQAEKVIDGDDDGDGVLNSIDKCPNTPKGVPVNSLGCALDAKVDFTVNVQFDSGKSVVKEKYRGELEKMANLLKDHDDVNAEIQGYTDNSGKKEPNVKLSAARAKAVQEYLVKNLGVDAKRLTSNGYGPEHPIAENTTVEGRARNRRVIASLTSRK